MKNTPDRSETPAILRLKAEERLKKALPKTSAKLSENDTLKLIHELQVHQMQNSATLIG